MWLVSQQGRPLAWERPRNRAEAMDAGRRAPTMRYVSFGTTGLRVSALGFGCAPMGSRFGKRESLRALAAAYDSGITFFDTARSYGYGDSERILGGFLRDKRHRVVVSTKFGINAGRSSPVRRALKAVARRVFQLAPQVRAAAAPRLGAQFTRGAFSVADMQASVEQSLKELGTDHIDVLFLHGAPPTAVEDDELFARLDDLVRSGKVRFVGIASSAEVIAQALRRRRAQIGAVQFHQSLLDQSDAAAVRAEPASAGVGVMAHQPMGGIGGVLRIRATLEALARSDEGTPDLRARLARLDDRSLADIAINGVLHETGIEVAVSSMFTVEHVRTNAGVAGDSRFSGEELRCIQQWFRAQTAKPAH